VTTIVTAPEEIPEKGFKVFLGGAIDMGDAPNWQAQIIEMLSGQESLVLINPRRPSFTPDILDEQIRWELEALEKADLIIIWFPVKAKAPISFLEVGLYMNSGKLIVGAEEGFYRRRNLELTCEHFETPLRQSLGEIVHDILSRKTLFAGVNT
jgi:hypothetical protein